MPTRADGTAVGRGLWETSLCTVVGRTAPLSEATVRVLWLWPQRLN